MYIGVDYYPEHWKRERWPLDAKLMRQAGFNVVRLAEFAWVFMEPEEGRFEFELFDEALGILRENGIAAILGTPTAVMPAWVARKYPETLAMQSNGQRVAWGVRKNNCFSAGTYRLLSERITRAMAEHFRDTPNIIGWQTDNEFGHPVCYCDTCRDGFRDWLRAKYRTLAELNRAWGTHFWGHRYGEWAEIPIPGDRNGSNPSALLDWQRFFSWLNVRFQRDQVKILRAVCPKHFVTHNFMGLFSDLNYYDLAADLDFVTWDNYPVWNKPQINYDAAAAADVMRGLKRKNFWIMEQTAGPGGWGAFGRNPRPGEIRLISYQQLAHGADGQIWFRWRSCTAGREQYWHGLLGHDGKPFRRYREAAQVAREYHRLARQLAGTTVKSQVAIVYDYESCWATRIQPAYPKNDYHEAMRRYHRALFRVGVNVDFIPPTADFSQYRVVIAPHLYVLPDSVAKKLNEFVKAGGVLLADCRTGVKDETSLCHERTLPGLLAPTLGITIEEYETIPEGVEYALQGLDCQWTGIHYADWLTPKGAETLVSYETPHMQKFAAATRHGRAYYVGTIFKEEAFYDKLMAGVLKTARIRPLVKPPVGVEVSLRQGAGKRLLFVLNHTEERQSVAVPAGKTDLLTGRSVGASLNLKPFDIAVLKL